MKDNIILSAVVSVLAILAALLIRLTGIDYLTGLSTLSIIGYLAMVVTVQITLRLSFINSVVTTTFAFFYAIVFLSQKDLLILAFVPLLFAATIVTINTLSDEPKTMANRVDYICQMLAVSLAQFIILFGLIVCIVKV